MSIMRHPLLRILVALLIGVVTPLCCCQAMAIVGSGCGLGHAAASVSDACCGGCKDGSESGEGDAPVEPSTPHPSDCPSCPSCQGTASGPGLKADATLPTIEQAWNAIATCALAVVLDLPEADDAAHHGRPSWWRDPPCIRANREALRWHCALIV
jgi:hypothetical protein